MKVNLNQAVKMFFGNSSLEMVYFEAVANAFDANATVININVSINAINQPETLKIEISDNGIGFTDDRYKKFSNLFDVNESTHKGLGRLVYLCYFNNIEVDSYFNNDKRRSFKFTEEFDELAFTIENIRYDETKTSFKMTNYVLQKIAKKEYIQSGTIKHRILEEFYSSLFKMKEQNKSFQINIETSLGENTTKHSISNSDIAEFTKVELASKISLFDNLLLYYSIRKVDSRDSSLIAAISVDNRTVKVNLIAEENMPLGYEMVFLLYSDFFAGKIDAVRQNLTISQPDFKIIEKAFREGVIAVIEQEIPKIKDSNKQVEKALINKYPHLSGYYEAQNIGYISREEILKKAQAKFFREQKEILEATSLNDEQFQKSLEISSRTLTEYILFRQKTIEKLKTSTNEDSETELHKLFASMRSEGRFEKDNIENDFYRNNAWLLDDKYMTYETVLSDRDMRELIKEISEEDIVDDNRPDIALMFSNDPKDKKPFDVVIVELKKRGISLEENIKVITQLEKRARKLMKYYNNQIQRIWFYGIIEFNEDVEMHLAGEYTELYSSGKMFYKETNVAISLDPKIILPIGVFIWDLDAVIYDADARNSAFLNLVKSKFSESSNEE